MELHTRDSTPVLKYVCFSNTAAVDEFRKKFERMAKGKFILKKVRENHKKLILERSKFKELRGGLQNKNSTFLVSMYTTGRRKHWTSPREQLKQNTLSVKRKQSTFSPVPRVLAKESLGHINKHIIKEDCRSSLEKKLIRYRMNMRQQERCMSDNMSPVNSTACETTTNTISTFRHRPEHARNEKFSCKNIRVDLTTLRLKRDSKNVQRRALSPGLLPRQTLITTTSFWNPKRQIRRNPKRIEYLKRLVSDEELAEFRDKIQSEYRMPKLRR